jgi:hypothetical protein
LGIAMQANVASFCWRLDAISKSATVEKNGKKQMVWTRVTVSKIGARFAPALDLRSAYFIQAPLSHSHGLGRAQQRGLGLGSFSL